MSVFLRRQAGQAMVLSLVFMAVTVLTMLVLYNQGTLLRHKVQSENASDAAVYSVAKLAARHMNMSAYLNRAMVANDILVGQMSGLVSSLRRYEYIDTFVRTFPLYQIPLAPSPTTIAHLLTPVTAPVARVFGAIGRPVVATMPYVGKASAGWNQALGGFETVFAVATSATQFAAAQNVVKAHANPRQMKQGNGPAIAPVGYFFLASRLAQTYRSDDISVEGLEDPISPLTLLYENAGKLPSLSNAERAHIERYLAENEALIGRAVLTLNKKGAGGAIGIDAFFDEDAAENSHRYAALVNQSRDDFLYNRGRWLGPPPIKASFGLDVGIARVDIRFEASMGIETDGGSLYRWNTLAAGGEEKYQWTSLDVITGLMNFYVEFRVEVAGFSTGWLPLPVPGLPYIKNLPLPLGGATHQFVDEYADRLLTFPQWLGGGEPTTKLRTDELPDAPKSAAEVAAIADEMLARLFGGYGDAISVKKYYYAPTLFWMETLGLFGRLPGLANEGAGGIPSFWSVDDALREQYRTPPYALAVVQDLADVSTTDNFPLASGGSSKPIRGLIGRKSPAAANGQQLPAWTDISVETRSVGIKATKFLTGADKPIISLSSAELYHKRRGTREKANLFSPFWDARLVENSPVSVMILRGLQDPLQVMRTLVGNDPAGAAMKYLRGRAEQMIKQAVDDIPPPFDDLVEELGEKALPFN